MPCLIAWCLSVLMLAGIPTARGAGAPTDRPILRVDTTMHTALVRRIVVDERHQRLVTAADDKTVRIWRARDGRLLRTLRPPIDAGHEGQLFGLAVSPDGQRIAAGGWTCWDWEGAGCVYVFDAHTGDLLHRVRGLPDAIAALAWSPDGRRLAVGLQGRGGVRIFSTDTFVEVARDTDWRDRVMELDYDARGALLAVGSDRHLRVYRTDGRLYARVPLAAGAQPATARFSPDGMRVAIGYHDAGAITVFDTRDFARPIAPPLRSPLAGVSALTWSRDGRHLVLGGEGDALWRVDTTGAEPSQRLTPMAARTSELRTLRDGRIAFAAEDPRLGVLADDGRLLHERGPALLPLDERVSVLEMSADAAAIVLRARPDLPLRAFFARATDGVARTPPAVIAPRLEHPDWRVAHAGDGTVLVNGHAPRLDDYERVRVHAIAHDGAVIALGTEWSVRLLAPDAREHWRVRLSAIVRALNVSGDGRFVVAALSDGTVRWFRRADGVEVLAWFAAADSDDWIAWTPAGEYMSSPQGDEHIGWHLNRGPDAAADFHRAIQFERALYRPERVMQSLDAARPSTRGAGGSPPLDALRFAAIAPPRLHVHALPIRTAGTLRLRVRGERASAPLSELTVYVNDVPVLVRDARRLAAHEAERFDREVEVPALAADNDIRVESATDRSMGLVELSIEAEAGAARTDAGDLHVLAIGNNAFPGLAPTATLEFAARDAEGFAARLGVAARGVFRRAVVRVLSDERTERADAATIRAALDFVGQVRAIDTVVVYLASHGVSDGAGNFHLVPRDATADDMRAIRASVDHPGARDPRAGYPSLIPWTEFFEAMRDAAGRRLLVVDACHARAIEGRFEPYSLLKRSAAARFGLIVAARADEESQEYAPARHGLFTWALLEALGPAGDANGDGRVSVRELFDAAAPLVAAHVDRAVGPQTPQAVLPRALESMVIGASTHDRIGLGRTTASGR